MTKKINPVTGKEIDEMFDGHLEKPVSKMTTEEKIHWIWRQMVFKWEIRKGKMIYDDENENPNPSE
jgi:hypothetical protein